MAFIERIIQLAAFMGGDNDFQKADRQGGKLFCNGVIASVAKQSPDLQEKGVLVGPASETVSELPSVLSP